MNIFSDLDAIESIYTYGLHVYVDKWGNWIAEHYTTANGCADHPRKAIEACVDAIKLAQTTK